MGRIIVYDNVKARFKPLYRQLDHRLLNELPRLWDADPASLARRLHEAVAAKLSQLDRIDLQKSSSCGISLCWGDPSPALPS